MGDFDIDDFDSMSDEEKAELGAILKEQADRVISAAGSGEVPCGGCGKALPVERDGRAWSVRCPVCDWGVAGQGYIQPRFN